MATSATVSLSAPTEAMRLSRVKNTDGSDSLVKVTELAGSRAEAMDELDQTQDRSSYSGDDLQQIKGIGQAIAQAMNSVGINRYADLASFTPESLADLLQIEIPSVSPKRIEHDDWIGQAKTLAQSANTEREPTKEEEEVTKEPEEGAPVSPRWHQHAGFSVFFDYQIDDHGAHVWQTRAYHDETDIETSFPGVAPAPWVNWVIKQAELTTEPTQTETQIPPEPKLGETDIAEASEAEAQYEAELEIVEVRVTEIKPSSDVPEKRLQAGVRFQVVGSEAETVAAEFIPFRIELHTVDLESGASGLVASNDSELQPQVLKYTSEQTFPIPSVGRYELHTIVLLLPPAEMMAYHRGPTIKVVP